MNKIYKVIWNKNKNSYDVAPETAKNQGKQKSIMVNTGKFLAKSFIVALAVSIIGIPIDESKATIAINSNGRISVYKTNAAGEYVDKYGRATTNPDEYVLIGRQENNAVTVSGNIRGTSLATATGYRSIAIGESSTASAIDAISLGSSSRASGQNSISLGSQSSANGVGSISLGSNANIQGSTFNGAKANDSFSIALGSNSSATGASSISIGYAATSNSQSTTQSSGYTQGATSIGSASSAIGRQSVALGAAAQAKAEQSTAIGNDTVASGFGSISIGGDDTGYSADKDKSKVNDPYIYTQNTAVGYFKKNSSEQFNYAYRPSVATGIGAVTIGVHSQSLSDGSTAIGVSATAGDDANGVLDTPIVTAAKEATAVGAFARAKSLNSTAVGHNATAQNIKSTSIGNDATATGIQAVAIGNATLASGTSSAAIGDNAIASNENAISIGTNAQATAKNSISIGTGNKVTGAGSGAIGDPTTITGTNSYSLGNDNTIPDDNSTIVGNNNVLSQGDSGNSTSDNSHIMGNNVKVRGEGAIAIGNGVVTGDANYETGNGATENVIAIGNSSVGNGVSTLAIGTSAKAYGEKSIAIGDSALSAKDSGMKENIAIGSGAKVNKGSNSIVLGTGSYSDATNGSSIAIGFGANVTSATVSDGIAIGSNASVANTNGGVAIGKKAITTNSNGGEGSPIAIGDSSEATGTQSIAIGYNTKAWNNQIGETVIGSNANATANYGTIIGYGAKGLGNQTDQTVIGHNATASNTSQYATVIGSGATATREYSTVIGTNASSTTDGGVAIGSNSVSDRQNGGNGVTDVTRNPYIPSTATEAQKSAIQSTIGTTGAVSVGSDTVKRQIINVAAGSADSDAVNVAQLKAAVSTVSSDTTAAKTTVTSKNNTVSIIPSIEQDGHTNYDLSVKTDGATITTTDGTLHAVTTGFTTNDAGNVLATTGTSLVTGADVATAINSAGFKLTTGGTTSTAGVTALVTPGSTVTIAGGKNISVAQKNNVITVNTADNVVTTDTDKYVTEGTATYNQNGSGTATLTGTNELTATVTGLKNTIVTSGTVSYTTDGAGTGTITNNDGTTASITGLANNYVVSATPSTDGKTVTLTRNDGSEVAIDLTNTITKVTDTAATNAANKDFKLVKNPNNAADGSYSVAADGSVTLTVANNAGETQTVTIKDIASKTDGLTFTGNSGSTGLKALGSSIAVTGTNGITTTATEEGITINGSGLADTNLSNITNAGNTVISNIANKSVAITKGTNVSSVESQTVKNADGTSTTTYTINADGTTVSGSDAVTVTPGVKNTNNVTDYKVDLSQSSKDSLTKADTAIQEIKTQIDGTDVKTVTKTDNAVNFITGDNIELTPEHGGIKVALAKDLTGLNSVMSKTITGGTVVIGSGSNTTTLTSNADGLDVGGDKITNVASGVAGTDAVNVKQLNTTVATAKTEVKAGDNVNVVKTAGSAGNDIYTVSADLSGLGTMSSFTATSNGSTDATKSGSIQDTDVVNFVNGTNTTADTTVKADGSGIDVTYNLNKDLTGITSISNGGTKITVGDTTSPTSNTVNFGGATITNVTPGINPGDVATVGQLSKVAAGTNVVNVTTKEDSATKATIYTVNAKGTTASAGSTAVTVKAGIADTNNVTDYKVDLSQASKDSLMKADTAIQEIKTQIDGTDVKTLTKDNNSANFVSGHNIELTSDNGAIKIATTANASYTTVTAGNTTNNTTISGDSIMFKNGDTTNTITIKEGDRNVNGDIINRVTYTTTNPDGSTHTQQGATLEDGLLFGGDDNATNTVTRKLNQQLNILGGATDVTKNNIGVKYNDENSLIVQLAKNINLGNDGSVTTGNTVVNNGGVTVKDGNSTIILSPTGLTTTDGNKTVSVTSGGLNNGGNTITNVASGNVTNTDADNTNAANIGDVKTAVQKAGDTIVKTGTKYQGDNTAVTVTRKLGETLSVVGGATGTLSDNNIGVTGDANGSLKLQLAKDITGLTSVTTTDAAGNTNVMNGAGNTIANAVGDKTEVTAGNITTTNAAGDTNVMNGAGNTITNAAGDKTEVTAGNITTTDAAGSKTTINGDTITTTNAAGNTTIVNGAGVTIKNGVNDVTLTKDGLNNGNNQITNVASGGDTNTNAANIGDVKRIAGDTVTNELAKKTFGLTADDGNSATNTFDKTVGLKGDGQNISTSVNGTDVIVTMGKDLAVNTITAGKAGANGTDGTVAVNGKDGSSVVLNGKNGSIGLAGSDGKITTISTGSDDVGVNGDNGTSRIIYTDKDGSSQKVATMNDGIKYAGDIGTVSTKLNKTTKIVGESAGKALTDSNIGVVATQDGDNAKLVVKLAKELTGLDSVSANTFTAGDTTVSTDGITINNGPSVTKTGIDAGGQTITNVAAGVNGNDAVNVNQLNEAVKNSKGSWKIDNNGSNVKEINSDANSVDFVNGNNTIVSVTGTSTGAKVKVDLANKVTIGDTTNGAPVTINGNTGTVSGLTNKTINYEGFADGSGRSATEEQVVEAANVIQQNVNRQIDGVRGAVADAGANAAAMAALKPMQYDPMEPTQVMIGAGGYKGSHAVAMGVAHYKNESTMFHAGVSVGAHDNMYNVGVTWKFGSRDEETAIPDRYKAGPISSVYVMQDEMSAVKAQNALLLSENKVQKDKLAEQDSKLATQEDRIEKLQMQIDALMAKLGM
ncbi:YadA-like family protein [Veillonella caviae]|uniref:YadA-like family protein n=2 Tax=Veillonella caviae TaxID=248316 RepID=UPI002A912AEC|nr:YadA-like family protein [Veillonella caviae]MDY5254352.1 YadA-like family protein [Veillonella caviae]